MTTFPFTKLIHNPQKPELVLANGQHFLVLNTSTGEVIQAYPENNKVDNVTDYFRSMKFNKDGSLLATSGENKQICIWNTNDWSLKLSRPAHKRVNAIAFDNNSTTVLAADKFGDVYCHDLNKEVKEDEKLNPIVGHVSMVTDMILTSDEKYVVTSDRDEHIRVSRYPNGYNIESFCLGHTDVVTCIKQLPWNKEVLVSAGGDGSIRLWDFVKGKQIQSVDLKEQIEPYKPSATDANSEDAIVSALTFDSNTQSIAVSFAKSTAVLILGYENNQLSYRQTLVVSSPILDIEFDLESKLWISLDGQELVTVATYVDTKFIEDSTLAQKINQAKVCESDRIPDLYTIFGLRKFLDLPDNLADEANKRRKTD